MMSTVRELIASASANADSEMRQEAELLLGHVLGRSRAWMFAHADFEPDMDARERFLSLLAARQRGEPVAYLIGRRGFWTLDLAVSNAVLIPRPETELLVELALERIPPDTDWNVADLGTGSGAIALAMASERPKLRVLATDMSGDALAVARANALRLSLSNVDFAQGHWCAALGTRMFDMIVSNPPYIAANDRHLEEGDLRFEPPSALSSGADGLDAIREIAKAVPHHLVSTGWLLLEHGYDQGSAVRTILELAGFVRTQTWCDYAGNDRITGARLR